METAGYAKVQWTWRERLMARLFPQPPRPIDASEKRTYITTEIRATFSIADLLRLCVTRHVHVTVITYTDVEVAEARSLSTFAVTR